MTAQMQNPGDGVAGASRNQLGGCLHSSLTGSGWQAQMLASRFCLAPWMARDMAHLCFGESRND
jgi:hypothetical protein